MAGQAHTPSTDALAALAAEWRGRQDQALKTAVRHKRHTLGVVMASQAETYRHCAAALESLIAPAVVRDQLAACPEVQNTESR